MQKSWKCQYVLFKIKAHFLDLSLLELPNWDISKNIYNIQAISSKNMALGHMQTVKARSTYDSMSSDQGLSQ